MRVIAIVVIGLVVVPACKTATRDQECAVGSDIPSEDSQTPCVEGLVCVSAHACDTGTSSICVPDGNRARGEPCASSADCANGLECAPDPNDNISNCVSYCGAVELFE